MHSPVYLAICAASLSGILVFGAPDLTSMVFASALAIAVLGVPHGGLDHWTGRRLLQRRLKSGWWAFFFPAYLFVGIVFALGWFVAPALTAVLFFLISAWHFGREDQQASPSHPSEPSTSRTHPAIEHVAAAAVGGLVIWIPVLVRSDEMQSLLRLIVFTEDVDTTNRIVEVTRMIAACLVPLAIVRMIAGLARSPLDCSGWVPLATGTIAFYMPILISFSIYFCGWHSWQGLRRLRREEVLTVGEFVRCVAPLSAAALLGVAAAGLWMQGWSAELLNDGRTSATLRTLFIGLSAIAVPHLLLHEFASKRRTTLRVVTDASDRHDSESRATIEPRSNQQVCT